ncbi:MAG: S41 family peptidase, partial [Planctomycetota bacterium]
PVFSPDGKMLAFIGRRNREESDIHFVYLRKADDDQSRRDRKVEKAEKKMKGRKQARPKKAPAAAPAPSAFEKWLKGMGAAKPAAEKKKPAARKSSVPAIDFDGISERIRRVSLPGVSERNLFWSHDSKKLCFRATIDGKEGIYTISPPDDLKPKLLSSTRGGDWRWLKEGNQIVGLAGGAPTSLSSKGRATGYPFRIENELDLPARHRAAFEMSWRIMRDQWYDPALNNRDWNAVREKYLAMAGDCLTVEELDQVVDMMLGELNGSHLNFSARDPGGFTPPVWQERTPHFGVRFDEKHAGPGLKVAHVIEGGPAWRKKSRIDVGDVILQADGRDLDPARDYARQLNGPAQRDIVLRVRNKGGKERDVVIRPASGGEIRRLLYDEWIEKNRRYVDERSKGTLGYLHVRGMNWSSFERFEAELYKVGHGKDGLVIDVRENGGGFTADHLLTVLCQPVHAVTVPRGGRAGYPQGRLVYARWHRPIIVLCNQNSFSNAEIFSHAIKTLERGRLVGVQTAGGVISTGGTRIMGFGFLRLPFRGWFVAGDGQDMELAGAVPDVVIWPQPEEWAKGVDRQLSKGIDLLLADVQTERERPRPPLRYRTGGEAQREDPRETRE